MPAESLQPSSHPYNPLAAQVRDDDRIASRQEQVAKLVVAGMRQRAIATALGVSVATINNDLKEIRERWKENISQLAEQARSLDVERTEELVRSLWADAVVKGDMAKMDRLIRVLELRVKILGYAGVPDKEDKGGPKTTINIVEVVRTVAQDAFTHIGGTGPIVDVKATEVKSG